MTSLPIAMQEYHTQLKKGLIQQAYKGLMDYMLELRTHFKNKYADNFVSGTLYFGYMDMTYFAFIPDSLKERGLKAAVVFLHEAFRFEVWLSGYNKQVQQKYWQFFKEQNWQKYTLLPSLEGEDAILTHVLAEEPDFSDLPALTNRIERGTVDFAAEVEKYLSGHAF
ncbi:MAG TPA: hypothetical protein VN376_02250 [Longilinea sp.]|nr:hypothetical protein [Longilinea sp.]